MIEAPALSALPGVRHGFFTRRGGTSTGIYDSLNTGLGSRDERDRVLANSDIVENRLGAAHLVPPYQHHSPDVIVVERPWPADAPPRADGLVTATPGLAIAVNTADCVPVILADGDSRIVAVAHAGWKGARAGIIEATVAAMVSLGADPRRMRAAIGPAISQAHYEVGPEFRDRFVADEPLNERFFTPARRAGHHMFDLAGYARARLAACALAHIEDLELCTYAGEDRFFSYRRATHRGEPDYGRQMSAVVVQP